MINHTYISRLITQGSFDSVEVLPDEVVNGRIDVFKVMKKFFNSRVERLKTYNGDVFAAFEAIRKIDAGFEELDRIELEMVKPMMSPEPESEEDK